MSKRSEYKKTWYLKNKERIAAKRNANKEQYSAKKKEYYRSNADAIRAKSREYGKTRWANPEKRAAAKEYYKSHNKTDEGKYTQLKRTAKERKIELSITLEQYKNIIKDRVCYYCDCSLQDAGGSSLNRIDNNKGYHIDNVKPCCKICNSIMNRFTIPELKSRVFKIVKRMEVKNEF